MMWVSGEFWVNFDAHTGNGLVEINDDPVNHNEILISRVAAAERECHTTNRVIKGDGDQLAAILVDLCRLVGVDGFDQDEGCSKDYESLGIPRRFFAS